MKLTVFFTLLITGSVSMAGHLGYIFPAGGRAGETVEVMIGGQNNWGCNDIYTDNPGIRCIKFIRGVNVPFFYSSQREYYKQYLQAKYLGKPVPPKPEKQDDWRKSKMLDEIDNLSPFQMDILLRRLYTRPDKLQISPSINQKSILKIQIAPDVKPGIYYLRLKGRGYLSNPVPFIVGTAPEIQEEGYLPPYRKAKTPVFKLPASVNGQIRPGEVDRYHVILKAGVRCYFKFYGRFFKPFVGDGVPGFFQPILELRNAAGKQVAIAERNGVEIDPVLVCTVPEDGTYTLLIRDSLHRGREDFVYRVDCGIGAPPQEKADFKLPDLPQKAYLPDMMVTEPVLVTGTLPSGMRATVRFSGKKGDVKVFETFARRCGSTLDTVLRLYGPDGKLVAENDDTTPEMLVGNAMHFADSHLMVTLPANGEYRLEMADRADEAGDFALRIDRPRPDFQLTVTPSGLESNRYNHLRVTLIIHRKEGFNEPIKLQLSGSKTALLTGSNIVPPGLNQMHITIFDKNSQKDYSPEVLQLTGTAKTADGLLTRQACAADPAMQAFAYTHYIPAPELLHASHWRIPLNCYQQDIPAQLKITPGETRTFNIRVFSLNATTEFSTPQMENAPGWLTIQTPKIKNHNPKKRTATLELKIKIAPDAPAGTDIVQEINLPFQFTVKDKENKSRTRKSTLPLPTMRIQIERIKQ